MTFGIPKIPTYYNFWMLKYRGKFKNFTFWKIYIVKKQVVFRVCKTSFQWVKLMSLLGPNFTRSKSNKVHFLVLDDHRYEISISKPKYIQFCLFSLCFLKRKLKSISILLVLVLVVNAGHDRFICFPTFVKHHYVILNSCNIFIRIHLNPL